MYGANCLFFCLGLSIAMGAAALGRHAGDGAQALESHNPGQEIDVTHVTMVIKKIAGIALAAGVMVLLMSILGCVATKTYEKPCSKIVLAVYSLLAFIAVILASVSSAGEFAVVDHLEMYEDSTNVPAEDSEVYGELVSLSNATYHTCCINVNGTMMPVPGVDRSGRSGRSGSSDSDSDSRSHGGKGPHPEDDEEGAGDEGHPSRRLRHKRLSRKLHGKDGKSRMQGKGPRGPGGPGGPPAPPRVCMALKEVLEERDVCASEEAFREELLEFLSQAVHSVAIGSTVIAVTCAGALVASCSLLWRKKQQAAVTEGATPVVVNGEAPSEGCCCCSRQPAAGSYYRQTDMRPIVVKDAAPAGGVQYA